MTTYYIYKIYCLDDTISDFYIGSTQSLKHRKYQHKTNCNNENGKIYNTKIYQTIRENGGWDNWTMVCVEELLDCSKIQARIREEEIRMELLATLNSRKCFTTLEQKKEYHTDYYMDYYIENKDEIKEQLRLYNEKNKDKIKERKRLYYEKNKDKIKEQKRLYYEKKKMK